MDSSFSKFQKLIRTIFQFESSDLDFGIYRMLNYKRDRIEKFIEEGLKNKVESTFEKHKTEKLENINQKFEEVKRKVKESLGGDAFTPTGDLKEEFKNTPVGKEFLEAKERLEEAKTIDEIKSQVFNDPYNFFSRYYEDGDFVPQYRYSIKGHKYAIPYNGEEVKLYWANAEHYYIKTGLLFRDYTFKARDYKIIFRTVEAKEELGSNKAPTHKYFILDDEDPLELSNNSLILRFQYRELTEENNKQENINKKIVEFVKNELHDKKRLSLTKYLLINKKKYHFLIERKDIIKGVRK